MHAGILKMNYSWTTALDRFGQNEPWEYIAVRLLCKNICILINKTSFNAFFDIWYWSKFCSLTISATLKNYITSTNMSFIYQLEHFVIVLQCSAWACKGNSLFNLELLFLADKVNVTYICMHENVKTHKCFNFKIWQIIIISDAVEKEDWMLI